MVEKKNTMVLGGWRVSPLEVFDQAGFVQSILSTPNAVGNLPSGGDWRTEEGFLNTTGRYCDAFAGWWPDQTLPVGYHAIQGTGPSTLPLLSREEVASSRWSGSSTSMTSQEQPLQWTRRWGREGCAGPPTWGCP